MEEGKRQLLEDLNKKQQSQQRDVIIRDVINGNYSDFGSKLSSPMHSLHKELLKLGYMDMAENVMEGVYDHIY